MFKTIGHDKVEKAILRTLLHYPNISKSMLSVHVRPLCKEWSDTLDKLVSDGKIIQEAIIRSTGRASVVYRVSDEIVVDDIVN